MRLVQPIEDGCRGEHDARVSDIRFAGSFDTDAFRGFHLDERSSAARRTKAVV